MIIDIHTHTFPVKIAGPALSGMQGNSHTALFSDGTVTGLRQEMAESGTDLSVVQPVATKPQQVEHINNVVFRTNAETRETGVLSFGAMHPLYEGKEKELERLAEGGVKGIKLHPVYDHADIDAPESVEVLKKCRELGLVVLIHAGWDIGIPGSAEAQPAKVRRALDAAGDVKMIAAHMGGWRCWEEAAKLLPDTGAYIDTAFSVGGLEGAPGDPYWREHDRSLLSAAAFRDLVRAWGAEKVLFGTDSPWGGQREEIRKIREAGLTEEEQGAVLGGNAKRLLRL